MKLVVQRVKRAEVRVGDEVTGRIEKGLCVLVGIAEGDTEKDVAWAARKTVHLRCFPDESGNMNRSLLDVGGAILAVSQFTLLGDCRKGRRPSFIAAASAEEAEALYERYVEELAGHGVDVETGVFQAMMEVELVNDGPVTLIIER